MRSPVVDLYLEGAVCSDEPYPQDMTTVEPSQPDGSAYPVTMPDSEWRARLSPMEYAVLREGGTERAFTGEYTDTETEGVYSCRACGCELFRSHEKFHSHCGWPSFFSPLAGDRIIEIEDRSLGMLRTEVRCASCGSHLGHVFAGEGYDTPTDLRYCINSVCLTLEPAGDGVDAGQ
jgi:peptide-methionine (R)-S-oxide reductase